MNKLVVSVVSHGHGASVESLLHSLSRISSASLVRVVLTLNIPEALPRTPEEGWSFALEVIQNARPQGFGENHNKALHEASEDFVCVMNPDVVLREDTTIDALLAAAGPATVGCAYPLQVDDQGHLQSIERNIPTVFSLFFRYTTRRQECSADWVNAAFLLMRAEVWRAVSGFDQRYFMYCEDVDFCLRVRLLGYSFAKVPVTVVHSGNRASHKNIRHFVWHVASLLRLWTSGVFWRFWWQKNRN